MTLECKAEVSGGILKEIARAINQVAAGPVKLHLSPEGLIVRAVDNDRVNIITVTLERAAFIKLTTGKTGFVVDPKKFDKLLGHLESSNVSLAIRTWDEFPGPSGETGKNSFLEIQQGQTALYFVNRIIGYQDPGEPAMDEARPAGRVTLLGRELAHAIRAVADTGSNARWYIDTEKKRFHIISERLGDTAELVECSFYEPRHLVRTDSEVGVTLSSHYLLAVAPILEIAGDVDIVLREDYPVEIKFNLADSNTCKVRYMLAPRIATD